MRSEALLEYDMQADPKSIILKRTMMLCVCVYSLSGHMVSFSRARVYTLTYYRLTEPHLNRHMEMLEEKRL